jgi:hypothetical protein
VTSLALVNPILEDIGQSAFDLTLVAGDAASQLVELSGGLDAFASKTNAYYQEFFTEQERMANLTNKLTDAFAEMDRALPRTREEFRKIVEAQDLMTDEGRKTFAALMNLAPAFAEITKESNSLTSALEKVLGLLKSYEKSMESVMLSGMSSTEKVAYFTKQANDAYGKLGDLLGSDDIEGQIQLHEEYKDAVMAQYSVEMSALDEQKATTKQMLSTIVDMKRWLDQIKLGSLSTLNPLRKLNEAQLQFAKTLSAAQAGDVTASQNLTNYADAYLQQAQDYYASSPAYAEIFNSVVGSVEELAMPAKTTAEILQEIQDQDSVFNTEANRIREQTIAALNLGVDKVTGDLFTYMSSSGDIYKAIVDILPEKLANIMSAKVNDAITSAYQQYLYRSPEQAGSQYWNNQVTSGNQSLGQVVNAIQNSPEAQIRSLYTSILGRTGEDVGVQYWTNQLSSGSSIDAIKDAFLNSPEYLGIPKYASGGLAAPGWAMVGEQGPELVNFSQPSRVYTAQDTRQMFAANDEGHGEAELKMIIVELQALIRQNGAGTQAMIEELQAVKAELEDLRARTRLRDGTNG